MRLGMPSTSGSSSTPPASGALAELQAWLATTVPLAIASVDDGKLQIDNSLRVEGFSIVYVACPS